MKYLIFLLCVSLYIVVSTTTGTHPLNERIANGKDASGNFLFACNIFVVNLVRPRIGGGTIISNRHVLTTASVVAGKGNSYRIDYRIRGDVNYRHTVSYVATPHANYNPLTMENDIAMLIIPQSSNRFPYDCIAKVGDRMYLPTGIRMAVTIVGHGFTTPDDTEMSRVPYYANYTTDSNRDSCNISAPTVLCLFGGNQCVLCNGDVGSGIFAYDAGKPILVGIVSNLPNTYCTYSGTILYSSYTAVGFFEEWIQTITGFY